MDSIPVTEPDLDALTRRAEAEGVEAVIEPLDDAMFWADQAKRLELLRRWGPATPPRTREVKVVLGTTNLNQFELMHHRHDEEQAARDELVTQVMKQVAKHLRADRWVAVRAEHLTKAGTPCAHGGGDLELTYRVEVAEIMGVRR